MVKVLPYDEIETWLGHPDLYRINLEETSNTPVDTDIGHFLEVSLRYPDIIKEKTGSFLFVLKMKFSIKINIIFM